MRSIVFALLALAACTKPNPNRCCTDEADCTSHGIPNGTTCADGLLCRGNQCIAVTCTTAAECDLSAPYCVASSCTEMCTADVDCPGFGGAANQAYCVSGACQQCRVGMDGDCSGATPVCDAGSCRACKAHSECASGVCAADGSCAAESDIAYVAPGASDTTDCSTATKCSLTHGVSLARKYVLLSPGTFTLSSTMTLAGNVWMIGSTSVKPSITMSAKGSIIVIAPLADVTLENLEVRGATGSGTNEPIGYGIECPSLPNGSRHVRLNGVDVDQNQYSGLEARSCFVDALHSTFNNNGVFGFEATDGTGTVEGCYATGNVTGGIYVDNGLFTIRNSFSVRNAGSGFNIAAIQGTVVEFNTAADNGSGMLCTNSGFAFPNNVIVRNGSNNISTACTYPSSLISDVTTGINFRSPDVAPYDYHISAGSLVIDMATTASPNVIDYDGQIRPQGAAKDVGADEYLP